MSLHYNLKAISGRNVPSLYDLGRKKVIGLSTCYSVYRHQPIQTDTLLRILNSTGCALEDFLCYRRDVPDVPSGKHFLDLNDMVSRGVISRTSKKRFDSGKTMSLSTLCAIADDQGVDLLDFLRIESRTVADDDGVLKKEKKVIYLTEW